MKKVGERRESRLKAWARWLHTVLATGLAMKLFNGESVALKQKKRRIAVGRGCRAMRLALGFSQNQIAKDLKISQGQISYVERAHKYTKADVVRLVFMYLADAAVMRDNVPDQTPDDILGLAQNGSALSSVTQKESKSSHRYIRTLGDKRRLFEDRALKIVRELHLPLQIVQDIVGMLLGGDIPRRKARGQSALVPWVGKVANGLRKNLGLTLQELSEGSNLAYATVNRLLYTNRSQNDTPKSVFKFLGDSIIRASGYEIPLGHRKADEKKPEPKPEETKAEKPRRLMTPEELVATIDRLIERRIGHKEPEPAPAIAAEELVVDDNGVTYTFRRPSTELVRMVAPGFGRRKA